MGARRDDWLTSELGDLVDPAPAVVVAVSKKERKTTNRNKKIYITGHRRAYTHTWGRAPRESGWLMWPEIDEGGHRPSNQSREMLRVLLNTHTDIKKRKKIRSCTFACVCAIFAGQRLEQSKDESSKHLENIFSFFFLNVFSKYIEDTSESIITPRWSGAWSASVPSPTRWLPIGYRETLLITSIIFWHLIEREREGGRSFVIPSVCVCLPPYGAEHLWAPGVCPPVERRMTRYWVTWWRDCRYLSNPNESWCTMEAASITHLRLKYSTCPATFSFTLFYFFILWFTPARHD